MRSKPPVASQTVNEQDAAVYIGLSVAYLQKARYLGKGPAYLKINRTVRYRVTDLDQWLERHRVETRESRVS